MDGKQVTKLRGWLRHRGAGGVLLVVCYLWLDHWRARRRTRLILGFALLASVSAMLLWPRSAHHHGRTVRVAAVSVVMQASLNARLLIAAKNDATVEVSACFREGANVNAVNGKGETPLTLACAEGHAAMMLLLLEHGANPNVQTFDNEEASDNSGRSAPLLIQTLRTFNRPMYGETTRRTLVRAMLDKGVDVHAVDANGNTSLLTALKIEEPEIAQWLIARGVDINRANHDGETPLYISVYTNNRQPDVLSTLLQCGADVMPAHNGGWNVLCWAAKEDNLPVARQVIQRGLAANSRSERGRTPLMYAAAHGSLAVLDLLLAQGADVNARDNMGWTALMFAAQVNNLAVVQVLLDHGADRQARDHESGWTAAQRAVHVEQEQTAELLRSGHTFKQQGVESRQQAHCGWGFSVAHRPTRVVVDAHRWIETMRCPDIPQDGGEGALGVTVVDDSGVRGRQFGGETFFFWPEVQVFHDTDGRSYAYIKGHHRAETNFIVAIQDHTLVKKRECYADYGACCQALRGGGVLITGFERSRDRDGTLMPGLPLSHEQDEVAKVSRFRQGTLTPLGMIFLPQ